MSASQQNGASLGDLLDKATASSNDLADSEKNIGLAKDDEAIDHAAEKRLVWKLDLYMMPLLFYLYMLCFLDRTNIGNANVAGLSRDLGLRGYMYNIGLSVFYIFYAGIEVPSNLALRKIGASLYIPIIIVAFGLVTTLTAFVKNFGGFLAVRIALGISEGGLMPAYLLVLSRFYSRKELVFRTCLFASSATIAGMFGGLLAWKFLQVDIPFLAERWRNIFFLEGIITLGSGLISFFLISNAPGSAKFLSAEERILADKRIKRENVGTKVLIEATKKEVIWRAFRNPNTLAAALGFGLSSCSLQGLALFIPTIIRGIDPTFTTVEIQLKTVPVYAVAFVIAISGALLCTYYDRRAYTIILVNIFAVVGFAMFLGTETSQTNVRYGALFLCAMGIYTPGPIWLSWGMANAGLDQERAVAAGLLVGLGTMGSVVASWSFLATDAPRYPIGNSLNLSVVLASQLLAGLLMVYNRRENAKRAQGARNHLLEGKTEEEIATLGHKHPDFAYKW